MNAKARRKLEMGARALDFSRAHPDASPGYTAAMTRLEERLARGERLASQQREGQLEVRAASARKAELRRAMRRAHLSHLAQVAKVAAREVPELAQKLVLRPGPTTYVAFRTAARGMAAEAQNQKEVLVKHGLVETVLDNLVQALDQFDGGTAGARGCQRGAQGGRRRSRPGRQRDGWPQPLPVHERRGAAGRVGEREQRAGGAAERHEHQTHA